jgi:signal recognition particle receptor subunit beta
VLPADPRTRPVSSATTSSRAVAADRAVRRTQASAGVDHLIGVTDKTQTTVSLDFGKIGINDELVLYLFGTPGQERFWFLWNGLFKGALGAVVLVDTRRLASSFRAIEEMERQDVPFVIALNVFPDSRSIRSTRSGTPSTSPRTSRSWPATPATAPPAVTYWSR